MMRLVIAVGTLAAAACAEKTPPAPNSSYVAGHRCGESGAAFEQCATVCGKMGGAKASCWEGYFDAAPASKCDGAAA